MEKEKKPQIRFQGFTDAWEQRKLGDIVRLNGRIGFRGYTEKDIISKEAGGILTFSPTNIVGNTLTTSCKNTYITRFKYDESPEIQVHNGDILFVKTGSTLGKSALITGLLEEATLNPQIVVMRVKAGEEQFIATVLTTESILKQVNSSKIGGAVPTLTETKIKEFSISIPSNDEEKKKIGNYFKLLDHLITLHQRKLDKLVKVKKAMLEKMFPKKGQQVPELRFQGFTDAWEQRKLSEVADIIGGGTPSTGVAEYWDGDIDWYAPAEINDQIYVDCSERKITRLGLENSSAKILPANKTVLFTSRAGIGKTAILRHDGATNQGFQSMVLNDETNPYFVFSMSSIIKEKAERVAAGSTFAEISGRMLGNLELWFPSKAEQDKIGGYFENLDHLITLHQRKLQLLKNIKKAMLEKMFL